MVDNGIKGNILNVASASSLRPANSAYILSKWGIRGLTLGLAKALAKDGITVNGIAPGPTATPMLIMIIRTIIWYWIVYHLEDILCLKKSLIWQ